MGKYKRNRDVPIKEKRPQGKDFAYFLELVKECAKMGPIAFTIVDDFGHQIPVRIEDGKPIEINGSKKNDGQVLDFISKAHSEFEGLFLEVMKTKYDPENQIMPRLHIAKLTDKAGFYGKPAIVEIHDGTKNRKFKIERTGAGARYYIDTVMVSKEKAVQFVNDNYANFLVGLRKAVKEMKGHKSSKNRFLAATGNKKKNEGPKHSEIVDGQLRVDIDSFLPQKQYASGVDKIMTRGDKIMTATKKGFIEE